MPDERAQIFAALEREADKAASYARSIGEAAFRGDEHILKLHLMQLRRGCIEMIQAQRLLEEFGGQGTREAARAAHGEDKRSGDGMA